MSMVYIERSEKEPMQEHALSAWQGFNWDRYQVHFFRPLSETLAQETYDNPYGIPVHRSIPMVGSVDSIRNYLRCAQIPVPDPMNVPDCLLPWAERRIERMKLSEALEEWHRNPRWGMFIKPADHHKLWTGGVIKNTDHIDLLLKPEGSWLCDPEKTDVIVSNEVEMLTEYRVFVFKHEIVGVKHYAGDPFLVPNKGVIEQMVFAGEDGNLPVFYALDVAMLHNGQTVIVECNDGWALGNYGWDPITYSRATAARWFQLFDPVYEVSRK